MGEYIPPKKGMELESNFLLTLSIIHTERSLETHKVFQPEKSLRNQDMVRRDGHSHKTTNLGEMMIAYTSMTH